MDELTVFIKVNTESLNEFSNSIPLRVSRKLKNNKETIKTITDKKYL